MEQGSSGSTAPKTPRILVIRGGAIGDFILTLPAIRQLRQSVPRAHVEVLGYPGIAELAVKAGLADEVRSLGDPRLARLFARNSELAPDLADYLRSFTLVVSYLFDPDSILKANLEALGVGTLLSCPHRVLSGQGHAAQQLARPLERLAMFLEEPGWRAPLFPESAARRPVRRVAIHPGSGSLSKNWPADRWLKLAGEIWSGWPEVEICLISGEAEAERGTLPDVLEDRFICWHGLPLTELVDRLSTCGLFLGHDSGISHLASACGVPCVLLFGPTDPETWAPPQPGVTVMQAPGGDLQALSIDAVRRVVLSLVG